MFRRTSERGLWRKESHGAPIYDTGEPPSKLRYVLYKGNETLRYATIYFMVDPGKRSKGVWFIKIRGWSEYQPTAYTYMYYAPKQYVEDLVRLAFDIKE